MAASSNLGRDLLRSRRTLEAVAQFQASVALAPRSADAYIEVAQAHAFAFESKEAGDHTRGADRAVRVAAKLAPDKALPLYEWLGKLMLLSSEYSKARSVCSKSLALNPQSATAYTCLGDCERGADSLESGTRHYQLAAKLAPHSAFAHVRLGALRRGHGRLHEASESLGTAYRLSRAALGKKTKKAGGGGGGSGGGGGGRPSAADPKAWQEGTLAAMNYAKILQELPPPLMLPTAAASHEGSHEGSHSTAEQPPVVNMSALSARRDEASRAVRLALQWSEHVHDPASRARVQLAHARFTLWQHNCTADGASTADSSRGRCVGDALQAAFGAYRQAIDAAARSRLGELMDQASAEYVTLAAMAQWREEAAVVGKESGGGLAAHQVVDSNGGVSDGGKSSSEGSGDAQAAASASTASSITFSAEQVQPAPCDEGSNGGWSCREASAPPGGDGGDSAYRCNIPRVSSTISPQDFYERYATPGRPVLIQGGCFAQSTLRERWTAAHLLGDHGSELINLTRSSVASARQYGGAMGDKETLLRTTLAEFVQSLASSEGIRRSPGPIDARDPWYLLTKHLTWVAADFEHPAYFEAYDAHSGFELPRSVRNEKALLSIGPVGSGAHFHQHADAWNCVAYGRKRWGLLSPSSEYMTPTDSTHVWWSSVRPRLLEQGFDGLQECVQEAGDLLYVPSAWLHSVYNLRTTVSLAVQIGSPASWQRFGLLPPEG